MRWGFTERMEGTYRGTAAGYPGGVFWFEFEVDMDRLSLKESLGTMTGRVTMEGVVDEARAEGTLDLSPFWKRRLVYRFAFSGPDGRRLRFEGAKRISGLQILRSWTTLPGRVSDESGAVVANAVVRFDLRRDLRPLLSSLRAA